MFKNYFTVALRNLKRNKTYSFINIFGLATGLACFIFIYLWVKDELTFDHFNEKYKNIYQFYEIQHYTGGESLYVTSTPAPLAPLVKSSFPQVKNVFRFNYAYQKITIRYNDKCFNEGKIALTDSGFFDAMTVHFIAGNPKTALTDIHSIVLTEKVAKKYFGNENPIGKIVKVDNRYAFTVTAVIKNFPENTSFEFEFLMPFPFYKELWNMDLEDWGWNSHSTYLLASDNFSVADFEKRFREGQKKMRKDTVTEFKLRPLDKIRLEHVDPKQSGSKIIIQLFSVVAIIVLLLACINFMNLTTARSLNRAKEVGVRKVLGSTRVQLIFQFLSETIIITTFALLIALLLVEMFMPNFNFITGKTISLNFSDWSMLVMLFLITFVTGIIAGIYPAFFLSAFEPIKVLKSNQKTSAKGGYFRKILVIFQFSLTIVFIITTIMIYRQIQFIQDRDLGLNKNNLMYVTLQGEIRPKYEVIKAELKKITGVLSATAVNQLPIQIGNSTTSINWEGRDTTQNTLISFISTDFDFVKTFGIKLADGRAFDEKFVTDSFNYLLNEEAVRQINKKPIVGETIQLWGRKGTVVGVVKNFHYQRLAQPIKPLIINFLDKRYISFLVLHLDSKNFSQTIKEVEARWKTLNPDFPIDYGFVDQEFDEMYRTEQQVSAILKYFSILAIIISCLGLFGLASYMAEQNSKAMVIRKIHGATVMQIVLLMSREFSKWIGIAALIALPLSNLLVNLLFENYTYHVDYSYILFGVVAIGIFVVAQITVLFQSLKTARQNPSKILKYE